MYLVLITLGIVLLYLFRELIRRIYLGSKLPGPPAWPIIGCSYKFFNKTPPENYEVMKKLYEQYKPVMRMWMGLELTVILTDPKDLEVVLSSQQIITKGALYTMLKPWLNDGLLLSTGKKWHQRRKILTPAFHFKILDQFVEIFDQQSNTLVEILSKVRPDEKTELYKYITLYALDVICESAMGTTKNAQRNADNVYVWAVKNMSKIMHRRVFDIKLRPNFLFKFSKLYKLQKESLEILHDFTNEVITQRRDELVKKSRKSIDQTDEAIDFGIKKKKAFLDILLESTIDGEPLSDADIREEVDTFMFEGHDTTTAGIHYTLYCLANHPEIQEKCFQEILSVIGTDKDRSISVSDLNNLQYLEKVIKESLRLFPPVPAYARITTEETVINGKTIPSNCTLMMPIVLMGNDKKYFDNPQEFRPERFNISEEKSSPTFAYVPFSAGPRNCIGQKFAMLEMKSGISKVLRHFELTLDEDSKRYPTLIPELILRAHNPINFYLSPRKYVHVYVYDPELID